MKKIIVPDVSNFNGIANFSMLVEFVTNEYKIKSGTNKLIDFRDNNEGNKGLCRLVNRFTYDSDFIARTEYVEWVICFWGPGLGDLSYLDIDPETTVICRICYLVCTHTTNKKHYYLFDKCPLSLSEAHEVDSEHAARHLAHAMDPDLTYSNGYCWNIKTDILKRLENGPLLDFLNGESDILMLESNGFPDSIVVEKRYGGGYHEITQVTSVIRINGAKEDEIYALTVNRGACKLGEFNGCIIAR